MGSNDLSWAKELPISRNNDSDSKNAVFIIRYFVPKYRRYSPVGVKNTEKVSKIH
jgi:hypothetical protein